MDRFGLSAIAVVLLFAETASSLYVSLKDDGPSVLGSTTSFVAQLYDSNGVKVENSTYSYFWSDNAQPQHKHTEEGQGTSKWNITYSAPGYSPGEYEVEVRVKKWITFFFYDVASQRIRINVTSLLNGGIQLVQNETVRSSNYVSSKLEVSHKIELSYPDARLLSSNGTVVNTYWFVGCALYGSTQDLTFTYNYTKTDLDTTRVIRAIVVAGKETNDNTTNTELKFGTNETESKETTFSPDRDCDNFPVLPQDPSKFYGYFKRQVVSTAPVHVDSFNGSTWLKTGEVLHLNVTCSGSSPFNHCVHFFPGEYNVTGNETCSEARTTQKCRIAFTRLMNHGTKYTVLFIIGNRVSKTVTPVGITRYSEKHHPQLSVVVVPISCCAVAIVLIIFGVAYYIQSRNRYRIEVADFDFSRASDTEYKTFKERLRDAFSSAFIRDNDEEYSDEGSHHYTGGGSVWSPTRKNSPPRQGLIESDSD